METGPWLKVSSDRLMKPGIEPATPGLQGMLIHYTTGAPTPDQVIIIKICLLYAFFEHYSDFIIVMVFNAEKSGNVCLYILFLDVTSSRIPSLVPCLKITLHNIAAKTGN